MLVNLRGSLVLLPLLALFACPASAAVDARAKVGETWGSVPLQFEENRAGESVRFLAHGPGYSVHLTSTDAALVLAKPGVRTNDEPSEAVTLRMTVVGARSTAAVAGVDELPGKANYFIGNDPSKWRTNVPTFAKVRHSAVYPGIDLVYYGQQRQLEYDFVVAPEADPNEIVLGFEGADSVEIDAQGDLVLHTVAGDVRQHKPVVYQETDGIRRGIEGSYVRKGTMRFGFAIAEYDRSRPLVIDPVLSYSTYLGGSASDGARGIVIDADGNAYVVGNTYSTNFPTTPGAFQSSPSTSIVVSKLNAAGSTLLYSTYLGAGEARGIAIDADRNVYLTGRTGTPTGCGGCPPPVPTTPGVFQNGYNTAEAFVTKLDATGSTLVYSTYLGGFADDVGTAIAVDATGNAYVTGTTKSVNLDPRSSPNANFATTPGAFQTFASVPSAFVVKLNPTATALVYSTLLGAGDASGIAVDAFGDAYVVGTTMARDYPTTIGAFQTVFAGIVDAYVTKLDPAGSALLYSTYLGGSRTGSPVDPANARTSGADIAIDAAGHAFVTGNTTANDFPVTPGAFQSHNALSPNTDAFVTKLDPSGTALVYSTYLGGNNNDSGLAIAADADGNAFVTGSTGSTDFPHTGDACQPGYRGSDDAFVTMFDPRGAAVYSTFLGGSGVDAGSGIAVDTGGNAYVAGVTGPAVPFEQTCPSCTAGTDNFPTTPGSFQPQYGGGQGDAFVAKIGKTTQLAASPPPASPATSSASPMPAAAASVEDSGQAAGSGGGGGGAFDWLTLSALLAAVGFARRRRAER